MRPLIIALILFCACTPTPATWGEVVDDIAHAACWKSYKCGDFNGEELEWCNREERWHLCELQDTCDAPVFGSVDLLVAQCADEIYRSECEGDWIEGTQCMHMMRHLRP